VTGFVSSSGLVEKVPYVYLPQYGQIIYPDAEIQFEGKGGNNYNIVQKAVHINSIDNKINL
jgi:hypothetical protein